jgi:S1-C subfamily serine protease
MKKIFISLLITASIITSVMITQPDVALKSLAMVDTTAEELAKLVQNKVLISDVASSSTITNATESVVTIHIVKNITRREIILANPFGESDSETTGFLVPIGYQEVIERRTIGSGSGVIISSSGYILTNNHVVSDPEARYRIILADGTQKYGTVVYQHPTEDIAIVDIEGSYSSVANLGSSEPLRRGQSVTAIGNPYGQAANTISTGTIVGFNRSIIARAGSLAEQLDGLVETSVPITPGYSGGPLVDSSGKVVGINVAKDSSVNNVSFAIPIQAIAEAIAPYIS